MSKDKQEKLPKTNLQEKLKGEGTDPTSSYSKIKLNSKGMMTDSTMDLQTNRTS